MKSERYYIMQLNGGLGNQFFQYAFSRNLCLTHNADLYLDRIIPDQTPSRPFTLQNVGGPFQELRKPKGLLSFARKRYIKRLRQNSNLVNEDSRIFDPRYLNAPPKSYIIGFFQSVSFFIDHHETVLKELRATIDDRSGYIREILDQKNARFAVSIHVRRGDYVSSPVANEHLGFLGSEYYRNAVSILKNELGGDIVFCIFSDDVREARSLMAPILGSAPMVIMSHPSNSEFDDLALMAACDHHIVANSTFSWWGMKLSRSNGLSIGPQNWFGDGTMPGFSQSIGALTHTC